MGETLKGTPTPESSTPNENEVHSEELRDTSQRVGDIGEAFRMAEASDFSEMTVKGYKRLAREAAERLEQATHPSDQEDARKSAEMNIEFARSTRRTAEGQAEKASQLYNEANALRERANEIFPGEEPSTQNERYAFALKEEVLKNADELEASTNGGSTSDETRKKAENNLRFMEETIRRDRFEAEQAAARTVDADDIRRKIDEIK